MEHFKNVVKYNIKLSLVLEVILLLSHTMKSAFDTSSQASGSHAKLLNFVACRSENGVLNISQKAEFVKHIPELSMAVCGTSCNNKKIVHYTRNLAKSRGSEMDIRISSITLKLGTWFLGSTPTPYTKFQHDLHIITMNLACTRHDEISNFKGKVLRYAAPDKLPLDPIGHMAAANGDLLQWDSSRENTVLFYPIIFPLPSIF